MKKNTKIKAQESSEVEKKLTLLEGELKQLALTIDKVEDEKLVIQNQLKKALADYSNLERDIEKRVQLRGIQTKLQIARVLLNSLDDISLAISNSEGIKLDEEGKRWLEGIKATLFDIEKSIAEFDIVKMNINKGDRFDSSLHEALGSVNEGEPGTIYDIVQPGYMLDDIIVRPARVIITKK